MLAQHDVRSQVGLSFLRNDLAQMIVQFDDGRDVDDGDVQLAFELFSIAGPYARQQREVLALGHDGQNVDEDGIAGCEQVAHQLTPLLGRIGAVLQGVGEIHVRTCDAQDALGLVADLEHGVLTACFVCAVQKHGRIRRDLLFENLAVSWH